MKLREDLVVLREENDKALGPLRDEVCVCLCLCVCVCVCVLCMLCVCSTLHTTNTTLTLYQVSKAREELSARVAEVLLSAHPTTLIHVCIVVFDCDCDCL